MTFIVLLQTGLTGNMLILSVLYSGGMMMQSSMITVGELSAFLLYAIYGTVSLSGKSLTFHYCYHITFLFIVVSIDLSLL